MTAPLLVEIGLEELPPGAMRPLGDQFADAVVKELDAANIARGRYQRFATPRRLAVLIDAVAASAPAYESVTEGPGVDVAFDSDGQPTAAATGFARSRQTTVDQLDVETTAKGERLVARREVAGRVLPDCFNELLYTAIDQLDIPKRMRWADHTSTFVRPVHWLTIIHGKRRVPAMLFGIKSGLETFGHRFHHPAPITLDNASDYAELLQTTGYVIADPDRRAESIRQQVEHAATENEARLVSTQSLFDEINALVEWPVALTGSFAERYLELPREVLIATMEHHQRYLPLEARDGSLINRFITVANVESTAPNKVVAGNERVIRPRLDDALFFWNQDLKRGLSSLTPGLARVQFETSLGSLADKQKRIASIADRLGPLFGVAPEQGGRAAELAKADLLTEMVDEFPDLQGVIGGYYASHEGEDAAVAQAITTQYQPAGATGPIPGTPTGQVLALADRLDTLAGIFAVEKRPSGDKDPYALRRAALGVIRILIESGVHLDLDATIQHALSAQPVEAPAGTAEALCMFHVERMRSYCLARSVESRDFDAVTAISWRDPVDVDARLSAVTEFRTHPDAPMVYEAHKRIRNILKKQGETPNEPSSGHYQEPAETQLAELLSTAEPRVETSVDYGNALQSLMRFATPLATFFDQVHVLVDDPALRNNRLALLATVDRQFCKVADISLLAD